MSPNSRKRITKDWEHIVREAKKHREESMTSSLDGFTDLPSPIPLQVVGIPQRLLSSSELKVISMPVDGLLFALSNGSISATSVAQAFLRTASLAQKLTNCITELLPSRCLGRARELDEFRSKNNRTVGPLHGIPISVKEHIGMAGLRLHAGYVAWWDNVATDDALLIQILHRAGAVFHARTTEPQGMMQLETDSNLYGTTENPFNRDLSPGGSSGGEGALIAMGGSCLGIGTDVGGSIRVPASANGIYGLKPTAFRIPTTGWSSTPPGADSITTVIGPLSRSLSGIDLFMKTVLDAKPWLVEPALVPMPWNLVASSPTKEKPLRIGVMFDDGVVLPHPPITRGLKELVQEIRSRLPNVLVRDFPAYKHDEGWAITSSLYFTDGGAADEEVIDQSGEPWKPLTRWIIKENPCVKDLNRSELEYWNEEREEFRSEYLRHWNSSTGKWCGDTGRWIDVVDVILCPVAPWIAAKHGTSKYWSYTSTWNLLDYPALAFPIPTGICASKDLDQKVQRRSFLSDVDKDIWQHYDPEAVDGMPVSLQLVGRRFEDETVVAVAQYLQRTLGS